MTSTYKLTNVITSGTLDAPILRNHLIIIVLMIIFVIIVVVGAMFAVVVVDVSSSDSCGATSGTFTLP